MEHIAGAPLPEPDRDLCPVEPLAPPEVQFAAELLSGFMKASPQNGATLLPGYVITPRPMTPAERAARYLPRANEKRRRDNAARLVKLKSEVEKQLASNPAISDFDLAIALNAAGLRTYTNLNFTATRVGELRRRLKRASVE